MILSGYKYHCSGGETFDSVALEIYGDEKYAAEILCANSGYCEKLAFTGGEILELPAIQMAVDRTNGATIRSAPWKE